MVTSFRFKRKTNLDVKNNGNKRRRLIFINKKIMGLNKLTDEDIKILQTFSMYVQSYGSKVVRTTLEVLHGGG